MTTKIEKDEYVFPPSFCRILMGQRNLPHSRRCLFIAENADPNCTICPIGQCTATDLETLMKALHQTQSLASNALQKR